MSDAALVAGLKALVVQERRLSAAMLEHLGEVEARQLYLPAACSSMFAYCVKMLGMSEEVAFKRIRAARAARRFPVVFEAVEEGRLHVTGVVLLAPHLTDENVGALLDEANGKSKAEIEVMVARVSPKPDVPARIEPVAEQGRLEVAPGPVVDPGPVRVAPLSPERFAVQMTVGAATKEKLERAQALLRHQVPTGDLAEVIDRALDALLDKIERRKLGKAEKPQNGQRKTSSPRYVPRSVRRKVLARDGERCSFVSEDGARCDEKGFLELDHVVPVARGGEATVEGIRVLCRSHNQYEARRVMGRDVVEAGQAAEDAGRRCDGWLATDGRDAGGCAARGGRKPGRGEGVEERMRAALVVLNGIYRGRRAGTRCEEPRLPWGARAVAVL